MKFPQKILTTASQLSYEWAPQSCRARSWYGIRTAVICSQYVRTLTLYCPRSKGRFRVPALPASSPISSDR